MRVDVNGVGIAVEVDGGGTPVLLVHGWPDTHTMWRHQVQALTGAGFRTIAPDLRGFGDSDKPDAVDQYSIPLLFTDLVGVLDHLDVERAHVVGHDWGAALAWVFATLAPERTISVTALSVGHPTAFAGAGLSQREKSWYMLLFQFAGVAEQWLMQNDWQNFREWSSHPEAGEIAERLADPASLTATLNLYRANVPPEALLGPGLELPPIVAPAMGVWSSADMALLEHQMRASEAFVTGPWRYERVEGVGHWMTLEAPERISALLLDFLRGLPA
jgi:pimeloyl-ACP methyl ester carboxylesterase